MSRPWRIVGLAAVALVILSTGYFVGFATYAPIQILRSKLSSVQRQAAEARQAERYLDKAAPEIISETLNGQKWLLADQRGKVVLVLVWSILCSNCVKEIPDLNRIESTYGSRKDFLMVGVHRFPERDVISCYCSAKGIRWPQLYEDESSQTGFIETMGISRTPTICVIDQAGRLRGINMDLAGAEGEVGKLLQE